MGLLELAEAVDAADNEDNSLDVLVEVALFERDSEWVAVRPNAAGTKVIFSKAEGADVTCWAHGWTMPSKKAETAASLRARHALALSKGLEE